MDPQPASKSESKSRLAARALRNAAAERVLGCQGGQNAARHIAEAERIESFATELMTPSGTPTVKCGAVIGVPGDSGPSREIVDTLRNPDQAALEASSARIDLLLSVPGDIVPLAVDAAASAKASNSLEKMLMHQLALIHTLTMKTGANALEIDRRAGVNGHGLKQADSVELSRLMQATSRLCSAFQDGLLTLQRLRNGSSQTVTVRHVTVNAGGRALIGNVKPGGRRSSKGTRGKGRNDP